MDNLLVFYQQCIKEILSEYERLSTEWSEVELLFDDERKRYMVLRVGWFKHKRVHRCLIHIDICDDKVMIQANNTEYLIDNELIDRGISKEKIIFAFLPPEARLNIEQKKIVHQTV